MKPPTSRHLLFVCFAAIAIGTAVIAAQSSLSDFGINQAQLNAGLVDSFVYDHLPMYPSRKAYGAASTAVRVAFVKNALSVVKAYTESSAFKADYDKRRVAAKPEPPAAQGSADAQMAKAQEAQRKQIEDMKAAVAKMSPDMQKQMQPVIAQAEAAMKQQNSDPQMAAMMKQAYAQKGENDQKDYQKDLAEYDTKFPADPRLLIAKRLREFLDVSKDVPFDAKLVSEGGGRMRFADASLESKPEQWKLCYRAGKEPVETARAFATAWLQQLGVK